MQQLDICTMPLVGKHLIEASAGTGKTYNITRLYLRLLLEQDLTVEQILVMTFTKDATQELKGRIEASLREALDNWQQLTQTDEFFIALAQKIEPEQAIIKLNQALLTLDEASIFTIHGFCNKVLNQFAFETGVSFQAQMQDTCAELELAVCQDWYRQLAATNEQQFKLLAKHYPTPEHFLKQFSRLLTEQQLPWFTQPAQYTEQLNQQIQQVIELLNDNKTQLFAWLVDVKKGAEQQQRIDEYQHLVDWLKQQQQHLPELLSTPLPKQFFTANRYARAKFKDQIKALISPYLKLVELVKGYKELRSKAECYQLICQAIAHIKQRVKQLKQQQNVLSFNDLISLLHEALQAEQGEFLAKQLFAQYPAALIDEFQDTDIIQYQIFQAIYQGDTSQLFLIGDPKQAIYGFRGGDIFAYLAARNDCNYQWLMDTNWRSTASMITSYNRLFYGAPFEQPSADVFGFGIDYQPVKASPKANHQAYPALNFVHFTTEDQKVAASFRKTMSTWLANEIVQLVSTGDYQAKDIAVLVRDGTEAAQIKQALTESKLASVYLSEKGNLFASVEAKALWQVLNGIINAEDERALTTALAGSLFNMSAERLYQAKQQALLWQQQRQIFIHLREQWQQAGFITMALQMLHQHCDIQAENKDRVLTNLLHLFEILQQASKQHHEPSALFYWFEQQLLHPDREYETELRLESDADLIKIVTQHGSKGLEYPVVFIPFATRYKNPLKVGNSYQQLLSYHNEQGQLVQHLGQDSQARQQFTKEALAESVRLFYVAVTRAEQKCYVLSSAFENCPLSPLGLCLQTSSAEQLTNKMAELVAEQSAHCQFISVDATEPLAVQVYQNQATANIEYQAAQFSGKIERDWWLSSFTALTRAHHHSGLTQPDRDLGVESSTIEAQSTEQLRFSLVKGAQAGSLLHDILEHIDFTQPDWQTVIKTMLNRYFPEQAIDSIALQQWLEQVLATPLAPITELSLAKLEQAQTLREVEFYFTMQGESKTKALNQLLTEYRQQVRKQFPQLPLNPAMLLANQHLKGMMHGFIDLVFEYQGKYYVADYKSSHLGEQFGHYQPELLCQHIEQNYYDLQYLIYALALHRYLKLRVEDYHVEQHFGGVFYCYLRGMQPSDNSGVYFQTISSETLNVLDQLFGQGVSHELA